MVATAETSPWPARLYPSWWPTGSQDRSKAPGTNPGAFVRSIGTYQLDLRHQLELADRLGVYPALARRRPGLGHACSPRRGWNGGYHDDEVRALVGLRGLSGRGSLGGGGRLGRRCRFALTV